MLNKHLPIVLTLALLAAVSGRVLGHCEIPCGIYTDEMRFQMIEEHCATIEKSMRQIQELMASQEPQHHANQLIRWVTNKETHATEIQQIVAQYFLTQRIKPEQDHYGQKLSLLHQMLVTAMKCKQSADPAQVEKLRELTQSFHGLYFGAEATHAAGHSTGHN